MSNNDKFSPLLFCQEDLDSSSLCACDMDFQPPTAAPTFNLNEPDPQRAQQLANMPVNTIQSTAGDENHILINVHPGLNLREATAIIHLVMRCWQDNKEYTFFFPSRNQNLNWTGTKNAKYAYLCRSILLYCAKMVIDAEVRFQITWAAMDLFQKFHYEMCYAQIQEAAKN